MWLSINIKKREKNVYKTLINTKNSFYNSIFLDHRVQNVSKISLNTSLPWLHWKIGQAFRREENKVKFLEEQFRNEKLSFVHKKENEHSSELSLSICEPYQRIFNLEMQKFGLENHCMLNARRPFCWKWIFFIVRCQILFFHYLLKTNKHILVGRFRLFNQF